jgi:hypothetical protein
LGRLVFSVVGGRFAGEEYQMTHRHVRIQAVNMSWQPEDEGPGDPVTLDVVIDDAARVIGRHLIFGLLGDPAVRTTWAPFVLRENGDVHFSGNETDTDSYYRTNFREKKIVVDEEFTSFDRYRKARLYQITKVVHLAAEGG